MKVIAAINNADAAADSGRKNHIAAPETARITAAAMGNIQFLAKEERFAQTISPIELK